MLAEKLQKTNLSFKREKKKVEPYIPLNMKLNNNDPKKKTHPKG